MSMLLHLFPVSYHIPEADRKCAHFQGNDLAASVESVELWQDLTVVLLCLKCILKGVSHLTRKVLVVEIL